MIVEYIFTVVITVGYLQQSQETKTNKISLHRTIKPLFCTSNNDSYAVEKTNCSRKHKFYIA